MDFEGDAVFLRFLETIRGKVTLVIVSQRPSFLRLANRTMFLHEGHLLDIEPSKVSTIREINSASSEKMGMVSSQDLPANYQPIAKSEYFTSPYKSNIGSSLLNTCSYHAL